MSDVDMKKVKEIIDDISIRYDRSGKYKNSEGNIKYRAAAVDFEEKTGFKNIAGRWKMLDGKTHPEAEYDYRKKYQRFALAYKMNFSREKLSKEECVAVDILINQSKHQLKGLNKTLDDLTKVNPDLKRLQIDRSDFFETYHTIIGLTSQYNVDDVNTFIAGKRKGAPQANPEQEARVDDIKKRLGVGFGWRPSDATLTKIEEQVNVRDAVKQKILGNVKA